MAQTQEEIDKKEKAKSTGKFVWFLLAVITILIAILSLWNFSQLMTEYGITAVSSIGDILGNEFNSWS